MEKSHLRVRRPERIIRCHFSRLMSERKMEIADVARATGLRRNTITLIYRETATRVDLAAIDRLCRLYECGVGHLHEFTDSTQMVSDIN